MKKILTVLILFFALQLNCFAQTGISFIYINGSNTNDNKMKNWYENGVRRLHPCMKKAFNQNPLAKKYFLKDGLYEINESPVIFFWGDKSYNDLKFVESDLEVSKGVSPWIAFKVRKLMAHYLHDAIWVQKYHNMSKVLNDLHKSVMNEYNAGNKTVLFGYSAGSFVTYEYLLTRLPFINVAEFYRKVGVPKEELDFVLKNPVNDTCMAALGQDLAVFSAAGHIVPLTNIPDFENNYLKLDNATKSVCIPEYSLKGIVNFATPLVLFYSDLSDPNFELTYYNRLLYEYIIEHDLFWLTVNYREDPLGFPGGRNLTVEEMENIANLNIDPHKGFIYDKSNVRGGNIVFTAHTSYWATRKTFSKAVARAYVDGYKYHYDDNFKQSTINKYEKKYHILP